MFYELNTVEDCDNHLAFIATLSLEQRELYKKIWQTKDMFGCDAIDGANFAMEIQTINEYYSDEIKCINVRINSHGGSVQDGLSICSAILNSAIPCDTYIDGMAYSMARSVDQRALILSRMTTTSSRMRS